MRDNFGGSGKPALNVQQFLGRSGIHHNNTTSRRMSSSNPGCKPP